MAKKEIHKPATEGDVAFIHNLISQLYTLKLRSVKAQADEIDLLDVSEFISVRDLSAIAKFVEANNIVAIPDIDQASSKLAKSLDAIKNGNENKVLQFIRAEGE